MFNAILLGLVQGLAEFLPVSSSGHLVIFTHILKGLPNLDQQLFYDILLHVGTLAAVAIFFRQRIMQIIRERDVRLLWTLVIAMVPTGIIAMAFKKTIESSFDSLTLVSILLLVNGLVLVCTRFRKEGEKGVGPLEALLIGTAQGIAVLPGISRSGSTIAMALFLGVRREEAGVFSFLLSLPAVSCAVLLKGKEMAESGAMGGLPWFRMGTGVLVAFVVGLIALKILMGFVRRGSLQGFGYYCFAAGAAGLLISRFI